MAVWILVCEMLLVLAMTTALLHKYGDWRRQHLLVSAATLVAWYFSFSIVAILPIDVVQTNYKQCLFNYNFNNNNNLSNFSRSRRSSQLGVSSDTFDSSLLDPNDSSPTGSTSSPRPHNASTPPPPSTVAPPTSPCSEPITNVDDDVIKALWLVVYWSSFVLTWLILPFMQSYSMAGEFTVLGKTKRSLIENAIFYASYMAIVFALVLYLIVKGQFKFDRESIKILVTTASNTWGLFFMVLLMGYGLVEVPRYVWDLSRREHRLRRTYFQVAKLHTEKGDATEALEDILDNIKDAHAQIPQTSMFYPHLQIILSESPSNFQDRLKSRSGMTLARGRDRAGDVGGGLGVPGAEYASEKRLVLLHKRLLVARQNLWRLEAKWEALLKKAFKLEDIVKSKSSGTSEFRRYSKGTSAKHPICTPRMEFYWRIVVVPKLFQISGVVLALLSVILVWSEVTFFRKEPVLSIYAIFLDLFAENNQYILIQVMCVLLLVFMCVTVYWTVFRVRFFNFYYLSPHHHTDEYTLLFSGMLLCRLTPSICLNFLGVAHMDSHVSDKKGQQSCSFTDVMGHLDIVYFISDGFNIYFPLVLIVLCLMTLFNVGSHILSFIGFQQFVGDGELTSELVDEGQQLIKREHRRIERENRGEQRRKEWDERLNKAGRDADQQHFGGGGGGVNDFDDLGGALTKQPYAQNSSRRGGGARNAAVDAIRAKYTRNGAGGIAQTSLANQTSRGAPTQNYVPSTNGSQSDNSATDLLDDDYVDFHDYAKRGDPNRPEFNLTAVKGTKAPASIFDDI